jgi:hypothetical protein
MDGTDQGQPQPQSKRSKVRVAGSMNTTISNMARYNIEHKQHGWYSQSYPNYLDYRDRNRTFDGMAAYDSMSAALATRQLRPRTLATSPPATISTC